MTELINEFKDNLTATKAPNTVKTYMSQLRVWGFNYTDMPKYEEVFSRFMELKEGRSRNSFCLLVNTLRALYEYYSDHISDGEYRRIMKLLKFTAEIKPRSPATIEVIQKINESEVQRQQDYAMIAAINIMFFAGLRVTEVCNLNISDYDGERITVYNSKRNKGRKCFIGVYPYINESIERWLSIRKDVEIDNLFVNRYLRCYNEETMGHSLQGFLRRYDVQNLTAHSFRHGCATFLHENNLSVLDIGDYLGHSSPQTTLRYIHNNSKILELKIKKAFDKGGSGE